MFLRALAETHREHAIWHVLSGMGSDGTAGLACIKEMGGVTIVQLPAEAEHGSMPRSAIESGMADFVLPAAEMPRKLPLRDMTSTHPAQAPCAGKPRRAGPARHRAAAASGPARRAGRPVRTHRPRFHHYRRPTLLRRLERRLQVRGTPDLAAYSRAAAGGWPRRRP
jgi:two-component system CheB/CheR fusion protein